MKRSIKYNILLVIGLFLFSISVISILVSAETFISQDENSAQLDYKGYIGSAYRLKTNNIVVNIKDVHNLDIWKASKATVSINYPIENTNVKVTPVIKSSELMEKVGVYKVFVSIKEDKSIHNTVTVFVVDKQSSMDNNTLIMGHDIILKDFEKKDLTVKKEIEIAGIHAYDLNSALDITKEVQENNGDLYKYINDDKKTPQTFSVRGVTLTISAFTKCTSNEKQVFNKAFKSLKNRLPNLGEKTQNLILVPLSLFLFIILINKFKKDRNERF